MESGGGVLSQNLKRLEELILNLSEFLRKQYKYNMCLGLVQNTPQQ